MKSEFKQMQGNRALFDDKSERYHRKGEPMKKIILVLLLLSVVGCSKIADPITQEETVNSENSFEFEYIEGVLTITNGENYVSLTDPEMFADIAINSYSATFDPTTQKLVFNFDLDSSHYCEGMPTSQATLKVFMDGEKTNRVERFGFKDCDSAVFESWTGFDYMNLIKDFEKINDALSS